MIDPSKNEQAAICAAGDAGGVYIERLGKTDVAMWAEVEWTSFINAVLTAYHEHLASVELDELL
jgi:hypothetical protein